MAGRDVHSNPAHTRRRGTGFAFLPGCGSDGTFSCGAQRARKFDIVVCERLCPFFIARESQHCSFFESDV